MRLFTVSVNFQEVHILACEAFVACKELQAYQNMLVLAKLGFEKSSAVRETHKSSFSHDKLWQQ